MMLWILERTDNSTDYDEHDSAVIRAESEEAARAIADSLKGEEGAPYRQPVLYPHGIWSDPKRVRCTPLLNLGEPGVILASFNAG